MPYGERRPARAKRLVRMYAKFQSWREKRTKHRAEREQEAGVSNRFFSRLRRSFLASDDASTTSTASFLKSDQESDQERLGKELKGVASFSASLPSLAEPEDEEDVDGFMADDERGLDDSSDVEMDIDDIEQQPTARRWVKEEIQEMYTHRYEAPRDRLPRPSQSYLHHVLITLKNGHADYFRQELRVTPYTFDKLVAAIENDPVFESCISMISS